MSFFFTAAKIEAKAKPKKVIKLADIPVTSLRELGCSVCPRDRDHDDLNAPKMQPSGQDDQAVIYLLGGSPSPEDDRANMHWNDDAGYAIWREFAEVKPSWSTADIRSNYITQCMGDRTSVEIECCRGRIVADIEKTKPLVIVGIGDDVLKWATKLEGRGADALTHRGTLFVVKIGNHTCYFYCLIYPNYVHKKKQGRLSEFELAVRHDVARIKARIKEGLPKPVAYSAPYDHGIECITGNEPGDLQRLAAALLELAREPKSTVDIETTGFRPYMLKDPRILTVAIGTYKRTVAFAVDHPEGWGTDARRTLVRGMLQVYLLHSGRKACHNLAFELEWFAYFFGPELLRRTEWDDTMAMANTIDEREGTKSLGTQTTIYFGFDVKKLTNMDTSRLLEYPLTKVLKYNGLDTKWSDLLRQVLEPVIMADDKFRIEYESKVQLAPTLVKTEIIGLDIDFVYAREMQRKYQGNVNTIEAKIKRCPEVKEYQQRFGTFSPGNSDQVLKLMKDVCKRPEIRVENPRDKTVRWTTDEEALATIPANAVPSAPLILEHRGALKVLGTYVEPALERQWVCSDGRIRCKYSSMRARTGRLASEDTNMQNWPARKYKEVRGMIYAPDGQSMVACDYGQIEFRVVGMASEDSNLVRYCWTGYDVHMFWAERLVKIYPKVIDWIVKEFTIDWDEKGIKTLRQEMKNKWVFPQLFGASMHSCAEALHLPDYVADDLGIEFWDDFPGVKAWQEKLLKSYEKNLYVETLGGRKRRGPMTKNQIINMPIQGTAFDIVTAGMDAISEYSDMHDDEEIHPRLNVHDDLTFVMRDLSLDTKIPIIAREMCMPRFEYINVPLIVEVKTGQRWHDLKEIKVYKSHEMFNTPNPYA